VLPIAAALQRAMRGGVHGGRDVSPKFPVDFAQIAPTS
jgi:hypothetical protein